MSWIENCKVLDILQVPEKQEHTMKMVDQSIHTETFPSLKFGKKALETREYNLQGMFQFSSSKSM